MVTTDRLNMELLEGSDRMSFEMKDKVNAALERMDYAAGYFPVTSLSMPVPPDTFPGMQVRQEDTGLRFIRNMLDNGWLPLGGDKFNTIGNGAIRALRPLRPLGTDAQHSAFPAILYKQDGSLMCTYRQGSDHITARDGVLKVVRSTDMGRTWTAPVTLLSLPGIDLRDSGLSESRDGTKVWLTYCKTTAIAPFNGAYFRTSTDGGVTFGTEIRIDNGVTAACVSSIVECDNGDLIMPWYGTTGAEGFRSVWIARSVNGGTSWTSTRLVNGATAGRHYEEPCIAKKGSTLGMTFRWGAIDSIGFTSSVDDGANWAGGTSEFLGTGKPNCFWVNEDTLAVIYRQRFDSSAVIRYTRNLGTSWHGEKQIERKLGTNGWMSYSDVAMVQQGIGILALGQETSTTLSRIFFSAVGEAGAVTPFGILPEEDIATAQNIDGVIFATNFDQPDGALASPWAVTVGAVNVSNGLAIPQTSGTQHIARIFAATVEYEIEAEMLWSGAGATGYGGIIFAMTDGASYWAFLRDVSAAVEVLRIYQWSGGVPTMKATINNSYEPSTYHKMRVVKKHGTVRCYYNDASVLGYKMSGPELTSTSAGLYAGITMQYSAGDSTQTWCRRFTIRK